MKVKVRRYENGVIYQHPFVRIMLQLLIMNCFALFYSNDDSIQLEILSNQDPMGGVI